MDIKTGVKAKAQTWVILPLPSGTELHPCSQHLYEYQHALGILTNPFAGFRIIQPPRHDALCGRGREPLVNTRLQMLRTETSQLRWLPCSRE